MKKIIPILCLSLVPLFALANEECAIDMVMKEQMTKANEKSKAAIEASIKERDISEEACLPTLSALGGALSATIPDFSGMARGLATKIRNMACKAADAAIKESTEGLNASWEAPFGLGGVSAGVSIDGESSATVSQSNSTTKMIESEIMGAASDLTESSLGVVSGGLDRKTSDITGIKRASADKFDHQLQQLREKKKNALNNF